MNYGSRSGLKHLGFFFWFKVLGKIILILEKNSLILGENNGNFF